MIEYTTGDILSLAGLDTDCIVIPVNNVGVMGAGLAKAFAEEELASPTEKKKFPRYSAIITDYKRRCAAGEFKGGDVMFCPVLDPDDGVPNVILAFTKEDWRNPSTIEWVESCLIKIKDLCKSQGIVRIALPLLGAGLGGLPAKQVGSLSRKTFIEEEWLKVSLFIPAAMLSAISRRNQAGTSSG